MSILEDQYYNGSYGIVVMPDSETVNLCYSLVKENFPNTWEYLLSPPFLPHLTLYHSRFSILPHSFVKELIKKLSEMLIGKMYTLDTFSSYGEKFIFWNINKEAISSSNYDLLLQAHEIALTLSSFIDQNAKKRSTEEKLTLSHQEQLYAEQYNHPLVKELYQPHITLAYDSQVSCYTHYCPSREHQFRIDRDFLTPEGPYFQDSFSKETD